MTTPSPQPVPAASRLLSALSKHGLAEVVDEKIATDIEVVARFTIRQNLCFCDLEDQSHIVGDDCPPHPLSP